MDISGRGDLERIFPRLRSTPYQITSPASINYNCFAWAACDMERHWEPDPLGQYYWPEGTQRAMTVGAFIETFARLGFELCASSVQEQGYEKIAIYADTSGTPTHMARQLLNGKWTSKLGDLEDIEHTLEGLAHSEYGTVVAFLKRARPR